MKRIVIDASVWIRLARSANGKPITDRLRQYNLLPVLNNYLLSEIHDALLKNPWATIKQADHFVNYLRGLSLFTAEHAVYRLGPDPKRQLTLRPCRAIQLPTYCNRR